MPGIDLTLPLLWDSWVDAALWDLLGMALWGSLVASGILTVVGLVRRSPLTLLLASLLSLGLSGLLAYMYIPLALVVPITQLALAIAVAAKCRPHRL